MKTNIERIAHIMEYSKSGALMQLFVMECLMKHSQGVIKNEKFVIERMQDSMISGEAWVACAKELNEYLNAND